MSAPNHIIYIDELSGEIKEIKDSRGVNPPEGVEDNVRIKYSYIEISDRPVYANTNIYNSTTDSFDPRIDKPNSYATWSAANARWEWTEEQVLEMVRRERNIRLFASDWAILPGSPLTYEQRAEMNVYRQALRDITTQVIGQDPLSFPTIQFISWPEPPSWFSNQ